MKLLMVCAFVGHCQSDVVKFGVYWHITTAATAAAADDDDDNYTHYCPAVTL